MFEFNLPLKIATPSGWAETALRDTDRLLLDHASCERKAAAQCMSLMQKYPDYPQLVEPMVALAREELLHFLQVTRILAKRGIRLDGDEKDPYVATLMGGLRVQRCERLLDRLLASAFIEARSCERLLLLGQACQDRELADFFTTLGKEEAGHFKVFTRLAGACFAEEEVAHRQKYFFELEAEAMLAAPHRAAIH